MMSNQGLGIRVSVSPLCTVFHRVRDVFGGPSVAILYVYSVARVSPANF